MFSEEDCMISEEDFSDHIVPLARNDEGEDWVDPHIFDDSDAPAWGVEKLKKILGQID